MPQGPPTPHGRPTEAGAGAAFVESERGLARGMAAASDVDIQHGPAEEPLREATLDTFGRLAIALTGAGQPLATYRGRITRPMEHTLYGHAPEWEVWVGKFQFDQWDAFVRRIPGPTVRDGVEDELVPGGPFPTRPAAGQAGIVYARTKTQPHA